MKLDARNPKKNTANSLEAAAVNNDLKKYKNDPVILKKMERAIATLKKVGYIPQS